MVVQDGATTFAFVGNDLCSLSRDLTDLARQRASQLTGIPLANIVIAAAWSNRQSASLEIVIPRLEGIAQGGSTRAPARGSSRPP